MAVGNTCHSVFLMLLSVANVSSYLQFVVPGVTQADSSSVYDFEGTYYCWPNRTVDGNFNQNIRNCLHTATTDVTEAWLRIDLQRMRSVKSVKFWYRNDRGDSTTNTIRLKRYSIRGSNTTAQSSITHVCYTDTGATTLPTIIEVECKLTARYIWFYQSHAPNKEVPMLEICEVQVFGCNEGFYGENCSKSCTHCKNSAVCDIDTGQCDELGCARPENQAPNCTGCKPGFYGESCSKTCDHCRNSETCDKDTGQCDSLGCSLPGFQPPACNECFPGFHGPDCRSHCSPFCRTYYCDRVTGACLHYCQNGHLGPYCNYTCPGGLYGQYCSKSCGNCLQNTTCNHGNGTCLDGCDAGYKGKYCTTPCSNGEYGGNCIHKCSENCGNGEVCDKVHGHCASCEPGFRGLQCDEKCKNRSFGEGCSKHCGGCLHGRACHHITGRCDLGCDPGWQKTDECNITCENGTFGKDCVHKCEGHCLNDEPCNNTDGTCSKCSSGWAGEFCNITERLLKEEMKQSVGVIVGPLLGVLVILTCVTFAIFIVRKRHKSKTTSEKVDDMNIYDLPNKGDKDYDYVNTLPSRDQST